jgi:23S rRNA pseudouridine1911/1915/1917 synthase
MKHPGLEAQHWIVTEESAGDRLDVFLTAKLLDITRSAIKIGIKNGHVMVNGKKPTVHRFLKEGDRIDYAPLEEVKKNPFVPKDGGPMPDLEDLIIEETKDWIVIDKPAGLLVHPDAKHKTGTLVDLLMKHDPKIAKVGEDPERPGIVHRLDREVSGLIVIAKTQEAYDSFKTQFASRKSQKHYLAFVYGEMPAEEGEIKFRIARSSSKPRMAARPVNEEEGKAAWTHYVVRERFTNATLVDVEILSGRTHQIRAHLQAMRCPIIGDSLYALKKVDRNLKAPRLMLQSVDLSFTDPSTGDAKRFTLEPDPAFEQVKTMLTTT